MLEIRLENVSKTISGVKILNQMTFDFEGGRIYGLKGKNGCGKTMLMRLIAGLMKPTSGHVRINDKELYKDIMMPESIGALIENPSFLPEYTGYENLRQLARLRKRISDSRIRETLELVGLDFEDNRKVRKYSLGMKQRLGVAAAIMEYPEIILLDEPINAIDELGVQQIKNVLLEMKNDDRIIIIACHDSEELYQLADYIITISDGRIVGEGECKIL